MDEARQLSLNAEHSQPELPLSSLYTLRFFRARLEAQFGDAHAALTLLDALPGWIDTRQDMLDGYLDVRAGAPDRAGQPREAYLTLRQLMDAVRRRHEQERITQLKALEVLRRIEEMRRAAVAFREQAAALETLHREASELSLTDDLTGVANRRQFVQCSALRAQDGSPVVMAFLDLDHFKAINDRCGHAAGNGVLRGVAHLLRAPVIWWRGWAVTNLW